MTIKTISMNCNGKGEDGKRDLCTALDCIGNGVLLLGPDNRVQHANRAFCSLTGMTAEQVANQEVGVLLHPHGEERACPLCLALRERRDGEIILDQDGPGNPFGRGVKVVLKVMRDKKGQPTSTVVTLLELAGPQQYERQLQEQIKLFAIGADIGRALTMGMSLRDTLQKCCELLVEHVEAAFARIWIYNPEGNILELQASAGMYTHIDGQHSVIPMDESYKIGAIALAGKPQLTNQLIGDPQIRDQEWARREGIEAFAGHPLRIEDRVIGVMGVFSRGKMSKLVLDYLATVADEISLGVVRKQHEKQLQDSNRALRMVSLCSEILVRATNERDFLQDICQAVTTEGGYLLAWIGLAELGDQKRVLPVAQAGFEDGYLETLRISWDEGKYGQGPTGTAIRTRKVVVCNDILTSPTYAPWREQALKRGYASSIALPLHHEGSKPFGAINIYARAPFAFSAQEVRLLQELANDILYGIISLRGKEQHKRASFELRRKSAEFEAIFKAIPDGVVFVDPERRIVRANPAVKAILGFDEDEIIGQKTEVFYARQEEFDEQGRLRYNPEAQLKTSPYEIEYRRKDGSVFPAETVGAAVKDDRGNMLGYVGIIRDLTEKKESEKERERLQQEVRRSQKMEALGTLAGGIAHDFNNILAAIMGYTELALYNLPQGSEIRQDLQDVAKAGLRAKELVKQILAFSRQVDEERKPVEFYIIVKEALKLLRASIPTNFDFQLDIEAYSGSVLADPSQLHQVVMNLCTNAYHAMRAQGKGVLRVGLHAHDFGKREIESYGLHLPVGKYLELEIADTGAGMTQDLLDRIFEPYFTTKERGEGTGLGLAVVHGIITKLNGGIAVSSIPSKGTTFRVFLPKVDGAAKEADAIIRQNLQTGSGRILLVDDEAVVVDIMKKMIEGLGYTVIPFTSSEEAYQAFVTSPGDFDLIFTDMAMPNMTGEELAVKIRAVRPETPIILCTGFSESMNEKKAQELGIRKFILKPVLLRDVAAALSNALGHAG